MFESMSRSHPCSLLIPVSTCRRVASHEHTPLCTSRMVRLLPGPLNLTSLGVRLRHCPPCLLGGI